MILKDELIEAPDGGYYTVPIHSENGHEGWAHIPGMGRREVYRVMPAYSWQVPSFAWYIKQLRSACGAEKESK